MVGNANRNGTVGLVMGRGLEVVWETTKAWMRDEWWLGAGRWRLMFGRCADVWMGEKVRES